MEIASSLLTTLPLELREEIYSWLLPDRKLLSNNLPSNKAYITFQSLSRTCRYLHVEVLAYYFKNLTVTFVFPHDFKTSVDWLPAPAGILKRLQRVRLQINMFAGCPEGYGFGYDFEDKHQRHLECFLRQLMRAKEEDQSEQWLDSLVLSMRVCARDITQGNEGFQAERTRHVRMFDEIRQKVGNFEVEVRFPKPAVSEPRQLLPSWSRHSIWSSGINLQLSQRN